MASKSIQHWSLSSCRSVLCKHCLLFWLAEWHSLTKFSLHTKSTLTYKDQVTTVLCQEPQQFCSVICLVFKTTELPKEAATLACRHSHKKAYSKHIAADLLM